MYISYILQLEWFQNFLNRDKPNVNNSPDPLCPFELEGLAHESMFYHLLDLHVNQPVFEPSKAPTLTFMWYSGKGYHVLH